MTSQRRSRGLHADEACKTLPVKRGEKICSLVHNNDSIRHGAPCPGCGAAK